MYIVKKIFCFFQAKKFIESLPQTVKTDMKKEDAETLQKQLEAVGGTVKLEEVF